MLDLDSDMAEQLAADHFPGHPDDFIVDAVARNNNAFQREVEAADRKEGEGHLTQTWIFTRLLRGHPVCGEWSVGEAVRGVERVLAAHGGWGVFPDHDVWERPCSAREDFLANWNRVETPAKLTPTPDQALPLAKRQPLASVDWPGAADRSYRRLVSLCFWFQRLLGDESFFLSCRKAGDTLGVSSDTANRLLRRAVDDGILELVEKGERGRASTYSFVMARVQYQAGEEAQDPFADVAQARGRS